MIKTILRTIAALVGFFALGLQFWLMAGDRSLPGLFATTIEFFSYFTMLSNTLAAFAMLAPLTAPASGVGRFLSKPSVRTATAGYLIVVAAVYFLFLRNIGDDHGWERFADQLMHYATPALMCQQCRYICSNASSQLMAIIWPHWGGVCRSQPSRRLLATEPYPRT